MGERYSSRDHARAMESSVEALSQELEAKEAEIARLAAEVEEARKDIDNAVSEAKKRCPDYPWKDANTASEAVWATGSSFEGTLEANNDLHKAIATLTARVRELEGAGRQEVRVEFAISTDMHHTAWVRIPAAPTMLGEAETWIERHRLPEYDYRISRVVKLFPKPDAALSNTARGAGAGKEIK